MNLLRPLLRDITWTRIILALVLTTVATAIVRPYFNYDISFDYLWFRMFIVTLVMLICFLITGVVHENLENPPISRLRAQFIALGAGSFVGPIVSGLLIGRSLTEMFTVEPMFWGMVFFTTVSIVIGVATAVLLVYRARAADAETEIARAEAKQNALQRQVLEAKLKLMQAQIEPHFLFNTLANVQHLVETDPPLASRTLDSLITYLRAALPQMREDGTTLGREADMANAYLTIQQLRMGPRLRFNVEIPTGLRGRRVPPMMLLTLVENAIKHGLDPLQQGGKITLSALETDSHLELTVADTGQGLTNSSGGVGLQNIRDRLAALYGKTAKLFFEENSPCGVIARIQLPLETPVEV
jgi:sensor histidine kinase YesM